MKKWSSRWIDTSQYKTKEILLYSISNRVINLKPANKAATEFICTCPFHKDRTPSLRIHNNRGKSDWGFKCFGCGKSGDVFVFLMLYERWEFWDALTYLKKCPFVLVKLKKWEHKRQIIIPFPVNEQGQFIWLSQDMRQIGYK